MTDTHEFGPSLLDLREIARTLEGVAVDIIKAGEQSVISHWYHSPLDCDIYIWTDKKHNLIKHQVSLCGQIVEWNLVEGIKTGYVLVKEVENGEGKEEICYDPSIQKTSLYQALSVLQLATCFEQDILSVVIENYSSNPRMDGMEPEEFLSRYGNVDKDVKMTRWQKLWNKIKSVIYND